MMEVMTLAAALRGAENLRFFTVGKGGATLFAKTGNKGTALVAAVDNADKANHLLYLYHKPDAEASGKVTVISSSGITVKATNAQGSVALEAAEGADVTQYVLQLG